MTEVGSRSLAAPEARRPASDAALSNQRVFDGDQLLNALSVAFLLCLVPDEPFGGNVYLTVSLVGFTLVGVANHLRPTRFRRLTHVVKALYTHVIAASLDERLFPAALFVSGLDLLPLAFKEESGRAKWAAMFEGLGATLRWGGIAGGFWRIGFSPGLWVLYAACTAAYFWERRRRIALGRRDDYSTLHALEHVAVFAYLLVLNAGRIDENRVFWLATSAFGLLVLTLVTLGIRCNWRAYRDVREWVPNWFDVRLKEALEDKARANARSLRFQHYVAKPFTPKMVNRRVDWRDIEQLVEDLSVEKPFDVVVGVLSGGAFIARYVANHLGIERVVYARSRLWSQISLLKNARTSLRYYLGKPNPTAVGFLDGAPDLEGMRVLVVDDSVCTGATLESVSRACRALGATEVATAALFCNPDHRTDYFVSESKTPLVWPWGWESD